MRMPKWLLLVISLLMSAPVPAADLAIPEFTPNVVDPGNVLDAAANERVNAELQRIRESSKVWGAVYIVDTLDGHAIEEVAVKTFEKWGLGQAGVDNGLLLVLAMDDRKSRFEVGYGPEGTITDVAAKLALDAHLAPKMREGDVAGAIIDSFGYLSRLVERDPVAVSELAALKSPVKVEEGFDGSNGMNAWYALVAWVWLGIPLHKLVLLLQRRLLFMRHPDLASNASEERVANGEHNILRKIPWDHLVGLPLMVSILPGLFVWMLAGVFPVVYDAALTVPGLAILIATLALGRRYSSPEAYQAYLVKVVEQRSDLLGKGHLVKSDAGTYTYTPAYRRASRSTSSSSRRSSSGGGRSGGGGASSSW